MTQPNMECIFFQLPPNMNQCGIDLLEVQLVNFSTDNL